ncbi:MAG: AraC family transcriptional regulator [Lentisphaerae bacterium]|nr:AraC family transcriptional regulator [Lentisphaerota bacterium]
MIAGFTHHAHFSRVFRQITGFTPSSFRKRKTYK